MNFIQAASNKIDRWQQKHKITAFPYAVIKKYGDDKAGYQAALLTYYGFLSLFPLLMVLTTITENFGGHNPEIEKAILDGAVSYFPVMGDELANNINSLNGNNFALLVGILFTLYGARGVADVFQRGMQKVWGIKKPIKSNFITKLTKNLSLIIVGGLGFIFASVSTSLAASSGQGWFWWAISIAINLFVLFWVFIFLLKESLPKKIGYKELWVGALCASVGFVFLQALGGYVVTHELKNLNALYSYFALTLGLLFWIYLQAQAIYYSAEIATVKAHKRWPRSFSEAEQ